MATVLLGRSTRSLVFKVDGLVPLADATGLIPVRHHLLSPSQHLTEDDAFEA